MGTPRRDWIQVDRLRDAFIESGLSLADVAARAGWWGRSVRGDVIANGQRVARAIGLQPNGDHPPQRYVREDTAQKLADVLHVDLDG